jgi:hypothetical protein
MIALSTNEHTKFDGLLRQILSWHASGDIRTVSAIGAISHLLTAAERDQKQEITAWIEDPRVLQNWKQGLTAGNAL